MKVLHVVCEYPSEQRPFANPFIKGQVDSLKEKGIEITVFDIKSHKSRLNYFSSIHKIKKIIACNNFDLVHAHYSYAGLSTYFAKPVIPFVLSLMGSDLLGVKDTNGNTKLRGKVDIGQANFISKRVDHLIVKSEEMKNKLKSPVPASVIPNGINMELFYPSDHLDARKELNIKEDEFVILFLGKPQKIQKNFNLAKGAVEAFSKKYSSVKFMNPFGISIEEVVKYMNASNVLLVTSFYEGSPNVVKEAMACNLPVISTEVGDVQDVIKKTNNCFIVKFSKEDIVEKLSIIYKNRSRSNGVENIQHLTNELIANKIINLYEKLLV